MCPPFVGRWPNADQTLRHGAVPKTPIFWATRGDRVKETNRNCNFEIVIKGLANTVL